MKKREKTVRGLTSSDVATRVLNGQTNRVTSKTSRSFGDIVRANVLTRFNGLLGLLVVVVLVVGSPIDALFGLVILINAIVGIAGELRAKWTLDRLALLSEQRAIARRDGQETSLAASELVLGDVLKLQVGDQVPVDGTVMSSEGLELNEALLTGESESVFKLPGASVLSGSFVVGGTGYIEATAVGKQAYIQSLSAQVKRFSRVRSELVDGTNKLLKYIGFVIVIVAPLLVWGQISNSGASLAEALLRSIAAIVGMIPEGLVLLTSLAFLLAVVALARRKVLVQQLPAVEGLARVDIVCLDKTGTLTDGTITFDKLVPLTSRALGPSKRALELFSHNPHSATLRAIHSEFGSSDSKKASYNVAFNSARKWSALRSGSGYWVLGAPEVLLEASHDKALKRAQEIATTGKRVLVLAETTVKPIASRRPSALAPKQLVVLSETVRPDAKTTLDFFAKQGVELRVISGDSPQTVGAVAAAVGMGSSQALDASTLSDQQLSRAVLNHKLFGRVSPEQKRVLVQALQAAGHTVAMTGDGVNDALALKDADIGIAMGSGSAAARSVAELVLLDDRFDRLPSVLAEGRRVIANIERVANLFVIKNVYSLGLAIAVTLAALPFPFLPRHSTILSSLSIGIPAFLFALAPNNRRYVAGFLRRVLSFAVPVGLLITALVSVSYVLVSSGSHDAAAASTAAAGVVMLVGSWVLVCVGRPLNGWKIGLIVLLLMLFVLAASWSLSADFLELRLPLGYMLSVAALSGIGAIGVEILWRASRRLVS